MLDGFNPEVDQIGFLGGQEQTKQSKRQQGEIGEGVIGVREAAAFWHIPGETADVPGLARAGNRRLETPQNLFAMEDDDRSKSILIGTEVYRDGGERDIYLPAEMLEETPPLHCEDWSGQEHVDAGYSGRIALDEGRGHQRRVSGNR